MQSAHVDRVDVRPLFAIDFDVDEQLVHDVGGGLVLEALVRHHVAPVASRVADGKQDRLVLGARFGQRLGTPGPPVHRVVLMLEKIGARFLTQTIFAHAVFSLRAGSLRAPVSADDDRGNDLEYVLDADAVIISRESSRDQGGARQDNRTWSVLFRGAFLVSSRLGFVMGMASAYGRNTVAAAAGNFPSRRRRHRRTDSRGVVSRAEFCVGRPLCARRSGRAGFRHWKCGRLSVLIARQLASEDADAAETFANALPACKARDRIVRGLAEGVSCAPRPFFW